MAKKKKSGKQLRSPNSPSSTVVHIALSTSPRVDQGVISLEEDLRLLKPALLYGDRVTLNGPSASMLSLVGELDTLTTDQKLLLLVQLAPVLTPESASGILESVQLLRGVQRPQMGSSKDALLQYQRAVAERAKIYAKLEEVWSEQLTPAVELLLQNSGASQLAAALQSGLLKIEPMPANDGDEWSDAVIAAFLERVATSLSKRGTYPMFDQATSNLVNSMVSEGIEKISESGRSRNKQVSLATDLINRLPAFPDASIAEVLEIRAELGNPLIRFRSAVVRLGDVVEAAGFEEDFTEQVDDIYIREVQPALLEIDERINENTYLRTLANMTVSDLSTTLPALVTIAVAPGLQALLLALGTAIVGGQVGKAFLNRRSTSKVIEQNEMFFLYHTNRLLE